MVHTHTKEDILLPCPAHRRLTTPLLPALQEAHAYFFCVEDRALLCRACDMAVHTANAFVSAHRRFLLTGVQVGLQPAAAAQDADPHPPAAAEPLQTPPPPDRKAAAAGDGSSPALLYSDDDIDWAAGADAGGGVSVAVTLPDWSLVHEQFGAPPVVPRHADPALARTPSSKRSPRRSVAAAFTVQGGGGLAGGLPDWPLDEFFGFSEYSTGLAFAENDTSKVSTQFSILRNGHGME